MRSTKEVFQSHLEKRKKGDVEVDIRDNYARDVIMIDRSDIYRGHAGVRNSADILKNYIRGGTYKYLRTVVSGDIAYLVWTADTPHGKIQHGTDTFFIKSGKIKIQTVYYSLPEKG